MQCDCYVGMGVKMRLMYLYESQNATCMFENESKCKFSGGMRVLGDARVVAHFLTPMEGTGNC